MKCKWCGKEITESQIRSGDAIKDYHTDCLDDQTRRRDDAYYRDETGKLANQRQ